MSEAENGIVKIRNVGTTDWVDGFDGTRYKIPAGAEVYLPVGAAITWLGDWHAHNDGRNNDRFAEHERLRMRYGAYENDGLWEQMKPKLEVYTTEGSRILTVVDDAADGTRPIIDLTENPGAGGAADRLVQLERELRILRAQVSGQSTLASSTDTGTLIVDKSDQPIVEVGVNTEPATDLKVVPTDAPTVTVPANPLNVKTVAPDVPKDTPSRLPVS